MLACTIVILNIGTPLFKFLDPPLEDVRGAHRNAQGSPEPQTPSDRGTFQVPENLLCTVEEVIYLLSTIDPSKASGPDRISARMLRSTASSIAPAITKLFNFSLILGKLPKEWKVAQVTPIPKSSLTTDPAKYRPVSLLSILSKLLEKHIQSVILEHLEVHSPISEHQWGFVKGRSTTGTLLSATHSWQEALESGVDVCAVFLDLKKAFDKVPHSLLLQKLESLNINLHLLNWIQDYLCNRSQYVVVNGESSTSAPVESGVPQGSVLGPSSLFTSTTSHRSV